MIEEVNVRISRKARDVIKNRALQVSIKTGKRYSIKDYLDDHTGVLKKKKT